MAMHAMLCRCVHCMLAPESAYATERFSADSAGDTFGDQLTCICPICAQVPGRKAHGVLVRLQIPAGDFTSDGANTASVPSYGAQGTSKGQQPSATPHGNLET